MFLFLFHLTELHSLCGVHNGISSHSYSTLGSRTMTRKSCIVEINNFQHWVDLCLIQIGSAICLRQTSCVKRSIKHSRRVSAWVLWAFITAILFFVLLFFFVTRSSKYHKNFISNSWFRSGRRYKVEWSELRFWESKIYFSRNWWNGAILYKAVNCRTKNF